MMGCKVITVVLLLCLMGCACVKAQCTRPQFEGNVVLSDEDLLKESFPDGSNAKFVCMTGYVPAVLGASKTVTCNGNKWTALALSCKRKSCGSLPDFPNGRYEIHTGIYFGDTVTGVCNQGYVSVSFGSAQRTCRAEGWDGRAPECEVVKCPSPPIIENGRFEYQDDTDKEYQYLEGVSYRCNSGFDLIGSAILTCSEDGDFQPEPPRCIVVSCPQPDVPNAYRTGGKSPPYGLNNFIEYKCNNNYVMVGEYSIRCTVNGWSPEPPRCLGYCQPPMFGGNVIMTKGSDSSQKFPDGSTVTFECKSGYIPINSAASKTAKCEGRDWQILELKCKGEYCELPEFGGNVIISKPNDSIKRFPDGSQVTFECKSGYAPVDSSASKLVICDDTRWTNLQLNCKGYCGPPNFGGNVTTAKEIDLYTFSDGTQLEFKCKSGLQPVDLKASRFVTCVGTKWTNLQLRCAEDGSLPPSTGLSTGAIVGIVLGLIVVFAGTCMVIYFIKKKKSNSSPS